MIGHRVVVAIFAALTALSFNAVSSDAAERKSARKSHLVDRTASTSSALSRQRILSGVKNWGIQLRLMDVDRISASPFDLVVVDYAPYRHLNFEFPFTPADVHKMQHSPTGKRRLVLAYLSIGEAEDYRFYWNRDWSEDGQRPSWLGEENPKWPGNYPVKFWASEWQRMIFDGPESYLDRLVAAGYDGVYLDRADVFEEWVKTNPEAGAQMASFIVKLGEHARKTRPNFLVVLQNAEELLRRQEVRASIDAFAKEDLFFGAKTSEEPNPGDMVSYSLDQLRLGRRNGLKILVLEYLSDAQKAALARKGITKEGFLPHIAERSLGTLALKGPDETDVQGGTTGEDGSEKRQQ